MQKQEWEAMKEPEGTEDLPRLDVCVFLADVTPVDAWDLRMSLRSWCANFPRMGRLFVVGKKPWWLCGDGVVHVPHADCYRKCKDANLVAKMLRLGFVDGLGERAVMTSDDHVVLQPVTPEVLGERYAEEDLTRVPKKVDGVWRKRVYHTRDVLVGRGRTAWHFDTHIPHVFDRERLEVLLDYPYGGDPGFTVFTLLLNAAYDFTGAAAPALISSARIRGRFAGEHDGTWVEKKMRENRFLNWDDAGMNAALARALVARFPEPCRYEWEARGGGDVSAGKVEVV